MFPSSVRPSNRPPHGSCPSAAIRRSFSRRAASCRPASLAASSDAEDGEGWVIQVRCEKTFQAKPGEIAEKWWLVDATDKVVGRLASEIAMILMGKHRPTYTAHVLCGDSVVVINCEKIKFSGKKLAQKEYDWFTGYTGRR